MTMQTEAKGGPALWEIPVAKAADIAAGYLEQIHSQRDADDPEARAALHELVNAQTGPQAGPGRAADFHNFGAVLARAGEYELACRVVRRGLERHRDDVDLLADLLEYASNCDRPADAAQAREALSRIPRRYWTWRGFLFLIRYLRDLAPQREAEGDDSLRGQILELIADFRRYRPTREESDLAEAEVLEAFGEADQALETLRRTLETRPVCPRCALHYGELLLERGDYAGARAAIQRGLLDASQSPFNDSYAHYLCGLCSHALLLRAEGKPQRRDVLEIYEDFDIALRDLRGNEEYRTTMQAKTAELVRRSRVPVPDRCEQLQALL